MIIILIYQLHKLMDLTYIGSILWIVEEGAKLEAAP
jgi:hypothetical protein